MRFAFVTLLGCLVTVAAIMLGMLGMDYIDPAIGHGLHPAIAFPLATLLVCLLFVIVAYIASTKTIEEHDADHDLMVKRY